MRSKNPTDLDFALELDFSEILTNPILDIAARFWADDRYEAFKTCYRSMRIVDDLVDNQKASGQELSAATQGRLASMIDDWINSLRRGRPTDAFMENLLETMERYRIPIWPWERLAAAMIYDLYHQGFGSFRVFLRYTEGAAIAPASVFMHLCGIRGEAGAVEPPVFDVRRAARPLALFSYMVHIMRDFEKDQRDHLNYYPDDMLALEGVTVETLRQAARDGEIGPPLRSLMARYKDIADRYRIMSRRTLDSIEPLLASRYRLSLEVIYSLYHQIFERVNPEQGRFSGDELNPTPEEIQRRIDTCIASFSPR